ncbi:serine/threonine-protein kinase [Streptomyces sp. NPDC050738]|uniref:serine/threonine-protein kinase n=1 Tax=Streptomyces sp. NPDC050738 TaxID=3154744 RepID=UPI003424B68B
MSHESHESHNSRLIAGRYRIGSRIGRGGMGTVWRATDELLGREVAVKELHLDSGEAAASALREARVVAQIKHPHVIGVHDVVVIEGESPYIVMELVLGGSLADRLSAQGPFAPAEAARIGIDLLGALAAAHARGVLHRDIKPANVLIEEDGRAVLTDFGIAQLSGSTTISSTGAFVGSPEYTAPERMQGGRTGPASDLWSLGVLLCTALSGKSPFHRDSLGGVLHAVVNDEIRPPEAAGPLLPVVQGLLERDPERRLGAAEAVRLLNAYLATGAVPATAAQAQAQTPTQTVTSAPTSAPAPTSTSYVLAPPEATAPASSSTPRKRRRRIAVTVVAAVLVGAGIAAAALSSSFGGDGDSHTDGKSTQSQAPAGTPTPTPTPSPTPSPKTTTLSSPPPSAAPSPEPSRTVPTGGYRTVTDRTGFTVTVPADSVRSTDGKRVFYKTPGEVFRIGVLDQGKTDTSPLELTRFEDSGGPDANPGYRDNKVTSTTHNGFPAATLEFTWDGFSEAEGPRRTFELCWAENGRTYNVWVSAPVSKAADAKRYFDTAVGSFVVSG